jgi:hypothetical protein
VQSGPVCGNVRQGRRVERRMVREWVREGGGRGGGGCDRYLSSGGVPLQQVATLLHPIRDPAVGLLFLLLHYSSHRQIYFQQMILYLN